MDKKDEILDNGENIDIEKPTVDKLNEFTNESLDSEEISDDIQVEATDADLKIEELTVKLQEEENKRLRLLADYENLKRRAVLDKEALQKYRAQSLLTNLIPVLDSFSRALSVEAKSEEAVSMMTGLDMVYRSLVTAIESEGLVEIEAQGKEFNPNFHQAIMTDSNPDMPSGSVLEELQKGYLLKDRVLRPSMVKVNE